MSFQTFQTFQTSTLTTSTLTTTKKFSRTVTAPNAPRKSDKNAKSWIDLVDEEFKPNRKSWADLVDEELGIQTPPAHDSKTCGQDRCILCESDVNDIDDPIFDFRFDGFSMERRLAQLI